MVFLWGLGSFMTPLWMPQSQASEVLPCHKQLAHKQPESAKQYTDSHKETPCGKDMMHCKCCVVQAMLLDFHEVVQSNPGQELIYLPPTAMNQYLPEMNIPPPKKI